MAEPKGHQCPECGAPRGADSSPSCGCTQRAADALRDARTAEAAAAEDFDPLRIRPYVELDGASEPAPQDSPRSADPDATMPIPAVPPEAPALPTPLGPSANEPSTADLSLFAGDAAPYDVEPDAGGPFGPGPGDPHADEDDEPSRRPRRTLMYGVAGALVTVITAAGLASGLFSYDTPTRDRALPEEVRASVPDNTTGAAAESPSASATSGAPTSAAPSSSATASRAPSPTPTRSSASPTATPTSTPTTTAPTTSATGSTGPPESGRDIEDPVLSRGDKGPEVVELELRLTELNLYTRDADGNYNEGVEDAVTRYQVARGVVPEDYGVYDLETRERLESETQEP
ncbi:peptidoglycan-binding domain-containing protein [Streptomyces sp. GESEQ-35]|uniref:peptidoglycan-binding domain-containing protein n=1 Tax=Streptomyces sp. GESEQ-35 TaxID=2812657 RepID=UPI001B3191CB|nr:peptidoglycan-binding domain-containing protein [Streptomyces sp. GESEQ-35]